jgi:2-hydroxy-3-oxopropionate reductase
MSENRESLPVLFLGAGIMGAPMARNVHRVGYRTIVWNRSPEKLKPLAEAGIATTESLSALSYAKPCAVIVMLSDGPAVESVLFERAPSGFRLSEALAPGSKVICMSSIPVETARSHAARLPKGVDYIDAPVSGGEKAAIEGTLTIMAGGDEKKLDETRPLLMTMGSTVTRIGPVGCGQLAKLANQMIVGITIGAVAEAMLLAKAGGADLTAVRKALLGGFADSEILRQHGSRMIEERFNPGAYATTQLKDLRTASCLAQSYALDLPVTALMTELFARMCEDGCGALDHSGLYLWLRRRAQETSTGAV